ncbi:spore germination protein KB [Paenibacillus cellulosilyticus]|uniref:Spore germination protein KB n=1 Tax=Paenibacillus cellulosilyticus TaxID=375489 RepID=A0A2V2YN51_9BACL|nr:endospore germination permease [Paenibacillus cellulosilyticus]PWV95904.1 spore germination protein KB [Paenibacillus cellulosilyticus]QKS47772.1 endospore germination permease [Paenibacillus cellulosilyticus]
MALLDNGKINGRQLMVLVFLYSVGTTVLVIPSGLASIAKQDAWIGGLVGILLGMLTVGLYVMLWRMYPDKTFVGICEAVLGRWAGIIISLIYSLYSFIGTATVLFYVTNFFQIHFLPRTPVVFTCILFAIIVVMGTRMGLESIARTSELMLPWFLILFFVLVTTLTPQINIDNMLPIYEAGTKSVIWAGITFAGTAYMPMVFLFALLPRVQDRQMNLARMGLFLAALAGGLCVVFVTLLCIWILGPDITMRSIFPSYALVKKISIGNFIQRIEAILAGLWFITTYMKTTFYFYSWVTSLSEILRLNNYRTLTLPCAIMMIIFSQIVYPNVIYMQHWDSIVFPPYIIAMGIVIPVVLWVIGLMRGAGKVSASQK